SNQGIAGGLVAVGVSDAEATIGGETTTTVASGAKLEADSGSLSVTAASTESADASAEADAGGVGAGVDGTATTTVTPKVQAGGGDEPGANPVRTTPQAGKGLTISAIEITTKALATKSGKVGGVIAGGKSTSKTTFGDSKNAPPVSHAAVGKNVDATVT